MLIGRVEFQRRQTLMQTTGIFQQKDEQVLVVMCVYICVTGHSACEVQAVCSSRRPTACCLAVDSEPAVCTNGLLIPIVPFFPVYQFPSPFPTPLIFIPNPVECSNQIQVPSDENL